MIRLTFHHVTEAEPVPPPARRTTSAGRARSLAARTLETGGTCNHSDHARTLQHTLDAAAASGVPYVVTVDPSGFVSVRLLRGSAA